MRKLVLSKPKDLKIVQCEIPEPAPGQVRIRVERVGVCGSDLTIYRGLHPYAKLPLVMGHEIAGSVDALGEGVTGLEKGQRVAVIPHKVCGKCRACQKEIYNYCPKLQCTGAEADGAYCDYFCIESKMVLPIPDNMRIEDTALLEPACVAYHGAKRGSIKKDDIVLIVGVGPIGIFCMQSCKALGAKKVFVADLDPKRLELAQKLGADGIINATQESLSEGFSRLGCDDNDVELYFDCVGEKGHVLNNILKIAPRGARIVVIGVLQNEYQLPNLQDFVQHEQTLLGTTMYTPLDYKEMIELMSSGKVHTDGLISHTITLEELPGLLHKLDQKLISTFKVMVNMTDLG
jgi:L-iditol 2-dehydrogenase